MFRRSGEKLPLPTQVLSSNSRHIFVYLAAPFAKETHLTHCGIPIPTEPRKTGVSLDFHMEREAVLHEVTG